MINSDKIIGIMGGTFNPIHKGHTGIARCAYEQSDIDEILFMPSGTPAYKDNSPIVSATDRCNMVKLAIKPFDYMSLSTIETDRPGNTYTADTLAQIYDSYKKIYFIIGADSLLYIQDWYHPEYICSNCHLLCANRDNNSASVLIDHKHFLADKYGAVIDFIDVPKLPYSSTDIRKKVAMGLSVKEDVGEEVEEYIKSRKLYV